MKIFFKQTIFIYISALISQSRLRRDSTHVTVPFSFLLVIFACTSHFVRLSLIKFQFEFSNSIVSFELSVRRTRKHGLSEEDRKYLLTLAAQVAAA